MNTPIRSNHLISKLCELYNLNDAGVRSININLKWDDIVTISFELVKSSGAIEIITPTVLNTTIDDSDDKE